MFIAILISLCITGFVFSGNDTTPGTEACPRRCKPTCAAPNPPNCTVNKNCTCKDGYIYPNRKNNTCIPIYQCPQDVGCNGDENAVVQQHVLPCRPTCKNPNQSYCSSKLALGCVCKPDYILSEPNGTCIALEDCPGGHPCGQNRTFSSCSVCPYNPCPRSEFPVWYGCDPIWPCPAGCVCESGYKSFGGKCILPEDCPPFKCNRPNEEWDGCPSQCFTDRCTDITKWFEPCESYGSCSPKCSCKDGFARAQNGTCIPIEDCPNFWSLDI